MGDSRDKDGVDEVGALRLVAAVCQFRGAVGGSSRYAELTEDAWWAWRAGTVSWLEWRSPRGGLPCAQLWGQWEAQEHGPWYQEVVTFPRI